MILDGYGVGPQGRGNAITTAKKPALDLIEKTYPFTTFQTRTHTNINTHGDGVGWRGGPNRRVFLGYRPYRS